MYSGKMKLDVEVDDLKEVTFTEDTCVIDCEHRQNLNWQCSEKNLITDNPDKGAYDMYYWESS